jgi:hypothetical protein
MEARNTHHVAIAPTPLRRDPTDWNRRNRLTENGPTDRHNTVNSIVVEVP